MSASLLITAFLMGLTGGPHCMAMCGAACAGIGQMAGSGQPPHPAGAVAGTAAATTAPAAAAARRQGTAMGLFHLGRLLGYGAIGAVAAATMQGLGWLTVQSAALRPVWSMLHVLALLLGVWLLVQARQPLWLERSARSIWAQVRRLQQRHGLFAPVLVGMAWALLPCGLLYSALMVAALTGVIWQGAVVMMVFVLGTSVALQLGSWLLLRLPLLGRGHGQWGMRLAGLALAISAGVGLWMGLVHQQAPWCAPPMA